MAKDRDTRKEYKRPQDQLVRMGRPALSVARRLWEWLRPRRFAILFVFLAGVFVLSAAMLIRGHIRGIGEEKALNELAAMTADNTKTPAPSPSGTSVSSPSPAPGTPDPLARYREMYSQNTDMAGWVRIEGTAIDYPVMYSSDDYYLSHNFDREESKSGVPFIDKRCTVEPLGTNTIIYGHHMKNGTMFASLIEYEDEDYYREHPVICFDTLHDQHEYEIIAVFRSQIFRQSDTVFKHYNFLNAESKADFDEYIANIKALSLYDTGVTAKYGDSLVTLVTCAYHTENGQFAVVARRSE